MKDMKTKTKLVDIEVLDGKTPVYKGKDGVKYFVSYKTGIDELSKDTRTFLNVSIQSENGKNPYSVSNFLKIPTDALVPVLDALKKMHSKYYGETEEETEEISTKKVVKESNSRLQEQINSLKETDTQILSLLNTLVKKKK